MQKDYWLTFISDKVKQRTTQENFFRLQTWGIGILGLVCLLSGIQHIMNAPSRLFLFSAKFCFVTLFHAWMALGVFLPAVLQKGEHALARMFNVRDFASLIFVGISLTFVSWIVFHLNWQIIQSLPDVQPSGLFVFTAWVNAIVTGVYFAGLIFYFLSLKFFPKALTRLLEKVNQHPMALFGFHGAMVLLGFFASGQLVELGSPTFFEQLRLSIVCWVALGAFPFWVGNLLQESYVSSLSQIELEVASGKIERGEDVLLRYKQVFISKRLASWLSKTSRWVATQAHEIAQYLHEAVTTIGLDKPAESQLNQVEDRYRKASLLCRKLEKSHERFTLNINFFSLLEVEREKVDEVKDQFSRELRHAKLELSSVRKRIDDKLVSLKDRERSEPSDIPVEQVPVNR